MVHIDPEFSLPKDNLRKINIDEHLYALALISLIHFDLCLIILIIRVIHKLRNVKQREKTR